MGTETEKAGYTIDVDVPCSQCAYNLRGLEAGGRCPECGRAIQPSCEEWQRAQLGLRAVDPVWFRNIHSGLGLIVVANLLLVALVFVPEGVFRDDFGGGRHTLLCFSTSMWVLAHWGVWKLAAMNREDCRLWMSRQWRSAVRLGVWVSVLAPGWYYLAASIRRDYYEFSSEIQIPGWTQDVGRWSLYAGIICTFHVLAVLNRCAAYDRAWKLLWVGRVLQWAVPGTLMSLYLSAVTWLLSEQSLEGLLIFPVPVVGTALVPRFLVNEWAQFVGRFWRDDTLVILGLALSSLCCVWALIVGLLRIRRAIKLGIKASLI